MDFETRLLRHLRATDEPIRLLPGINHEGRPTIWVEDVLYIAVGNTMVPAPTTQVAAVTGIDSFAPMGERP